MSENVLSEQPMPTRLTEYLDNGLDTEEFFHRGPFVDIAPEGGEALLVHTNKCLYYTLNTTSQLEQLFGIAKSITVDGHSEEIIQETNPFRQLKQLCSEVEEKHYIFINRLDHTVRDKFDIGTEEYYVVDVSTVTRDEFGQREYRTRMLVKQDELEEVIPNNITKSLGTPYECADRVLNTVEWVVE